jgi:signal peptide peptidase SppA
MTMLLRIAERVINRPLLVHPDKLLLILGVLEGRIPLGDVEPLRQAAESNIDAMPADAQLIMRGPAPRASRFVGSSIDEDPETGKKTGLPYKRTTDGVAVITITGSLINRGAWVGASSGETSYEGIQHQVAMAARDPRAKAILLDIESPGGEAVGAFEAAAAIRAVAAQKPTTAIANGMTASAAYALASGAQRIVATPTSLVGSIGVVMLHADYSRFLDKKGVTPSLIFAGAHKIDGNPFEPLTAGVREDLQREVNQYYDLFVETVAAGRRLMSPASIRQTEARTYIGRDAVDARLADDIGTFDDVLADLSARGRGRITVSLPTKGKPAMENTQEPPAVDAAGTVTVTDEQRQAKKAAKKRKFDAAVAVAVAEQMKGATTRLTAILASDKVKGREATALKLALASLAMSADEVTAFVAALPAGAAHASIAERMGSAGAALSLGAPAEAPAAQPTRNRVVERINARRGFKAA